MTSAISYNAKAGKGIRFLTRAGWRDEAIINGEKRYLKPNLLWYF